MLDILRNHESVYPLHRPSIPPAYKAHCSPAIASDVPNGLAFSKVGSHKPIDVDVRTVATSNQDISKMVQEGTFREDLFFRLNVVPIYVAPLRERSGDIPLLLEHFVNQFCKKYDQPKKEISAAALTRLESYEWRGNVRELKNNTERAVLFSGSFPKLELEHFFPSKDEVRSQGNLPLSAGGTLAEIEKQAILSTLEKTAQNRTQAARILAISVKTLRNKLKLYGLESTQAK